MRGELGGDLVANKINNENTTERLGFLVLMLIKAYLTNQRVRLVVLKNNSLY